MPKFYDNINLMRVGQLVEALLHKSAGAPGSNVEAQVWYDTADKTFKGNHGTDGVMKLSTRDIANADIASNAAIALSKLATDPLARANHTGSQAASTISDLATVVKGYTLDEFADPVAAIAMNSQQITGLADGSANNHAATVGQMNTAIAASVAAKDWKESVRAATTAAITLSGTQTIDGVAVIAGDRVLVKNQAAGADNGIYVVAAGAWARATDADSNTDVTSGMVVPITEGTANGDKFARLTTNDAIVLGTTALTFAIVQEGGGSSSTPGAGLVAGSGSDLDVNVGNGIAIVSDAVAVDTTVVARKYSALLGALTANTPVNVTHNLNNANPFAVTIWEVGATGEQVHLLVKKVDANNISVTSNTAFAANALEIRILA